MADIRWVILSDLHFGATNSLLTSLVDRTGSSSNAGFAADPSTPSPVLRGLLDGLRQLTEHQTEPPVLILAGDVLDLALSADEVAATVWSGFARLAFGGDQPVFDPIVHYVPGNHDHHLWETSRESQYTAYAGALPADQPLIPPWHTTKLGPAESPTAISGLLTGLARRQAGCGSVEVRVCYPNMALRSSDAQRCVVVSHGHFTESLYTLMSRLKGILYPDQRRFVPDDIDIWEGENFAWIDFFWSTLGRSGQVGSDVGLIYSDLTRPIDLDLLVSNLTTAMLAKGHGPRWLHPAEHWALNNIFRRELDEVARSERGTPDVALTAKGRVGLRAYLEGPVRDQLERELGRVPGNVTFVYGHTHKPLVEEWTLNGFPQPVLILNTGGWVVDTAVPAPAQAAVAVLLNEELDVASLELYRQDPGSAPTAPCILPPTAGAGRSAWQLDLASRIQPSSEPWASLSAAAADLVGQRHRMQAGAGGSGGPTSRSRRR